MTPDSLPPDLAQFISDQLALGKYESASDVVCDAVRVLREREVRLKSLQIDIQIGFNQLDSGECIELDSDDDIDTFFGDVLTRAVKRASSKECSQMLATSAFSTDFWNNPEDDEDWNGV